MFFTFPKNVKMSVYPVSGDLVGEKKGEGEREQKNLTFSVILLARRLASWQRCNVCRILTPALLCLDVKMCLNNYFRIDARILIGGRGWGADGARTMREKKKKRHLFTIPTNHDFLFFFSFGLELVWLFMFKRTMKNIFWAKREHEKTERELQLPGLC